MNEIRPIHWAGDTLELLDQTRLPLEQVTLEIGRYQDAVDAIRQMQVRGAPAIGVTAAYAMALAAREIESQAASRDGQDLMAQLQAARMGPARWPVLLDPDGFLAEGTGWNIFLVRKGVLYTPQPRNILLGVSRATTIELAVESEVPVREVNLGRYEALQADEIFCTSTTNCLVHAASFEGQPIGDGRPGPVFGRLVEAWKRLAGVDFVAQAHQYAERVAEWEESAQAVSQNR